MNCHVGVPTVFINIIFNVQPFVTSISAGFLFYLVNSNFNKNGERVISLRNSANKFLSDGFLYRENIFQIASRNVNLYTFKIMQSFFWDTLYNNLYAPLSNDKELLRR